MYREMNDPTTLKVMVVREALALANDLFAQQLHIASDCKMMVDGIKQGTSGIYRAIIQDIQEISAAFLFIDFVHELRNFNFVSMYS